MGLFLIATSANAATPNFCPPGSAAGQCDSPQAVAVDQSTGEPTSGSVYVGEDSGHRIDEFDAAGNFQRAFGWGVLNGAAELQVCTAATGCLQGLQGPGAGEIRPSALAIDPSSHGVYAVDYLENRVEEFTPAGEFVLTFGKEVNKTKLAELGSTEAEQNLCTKASGDTCGEGSLGTGPGAINTGFFGVANSGLALAVDPSQHVWFGDKDRLEEFSPAGAFLSELELPGVGIVHSLAVDGSNAFYVIGSEASGVRRYDSSGNLVVGWGTGGVVDESGHPNALGLDPASGGLFVSDQANSATASIFEYDPSGTQIESFGTGGVIGGPTGNALAFGEGVGRLYVVSSQGGESSAAQSFALPEPGPLPEENGAFAEAVKKTTATLKANLNPEGAATEFHFEYSTTTDFANCGLPANPNCHKTPESALGGEDFSQHLASAAISGLSVETTYHFRLVATNSNGTAIGEAATFTTEPPLRIDATYATEVSSTGATLGAAVNPLGDSASYRFEYLTQAEYEQNGNSFSGAHAPTTVPVPDGSIASSEADVTVSRHVSGLQPSTAYRYRIFLTNAATPAGIPGPARAFTIQGPGGPLTLPDHRAWELVSPIDKNGGGISGIDQGTYLTLVEAAAGGGAITYGSPVAFADPAGSPPGNQYLSARHGEAGWSTQNIGIPTNAETDFGLGDPPYKAFSSDLSSGLLSNGTGQTVIERTTLPTPPLPGTEAAPGFGNFYLRDNASAGYRAILTEAGAGAEALLPLLYEDATPDLRHIVFSEPGKGTANPTSKGNLYEWSEGTFQLLNLLPGKATPTSTSNGLGDGERQTGAGLRDLRALSTDGSRAVWAAATTGSQFDPPHNLYLRQNIGQPQSAFEGTKCTEAEAACTVQIDASEGGVGKGGNGVFLAASVDDSAIFFADHQRLTPDSTADQLKGEHPQRGDLYRFQPGAEAGHRLTDLTVDHADPTGAEVLGVLGASDDGSYLYFAANGVLTSTPNARGESASPGECNAESGAPGNTCNLYLYHGGEVTFIATLAGEDNELESDVVSFGAGEGQNTGAWRGVAFRDARLSPDGTHLLFVSYRALTGYDNTSAGGASCGKDAFGKPLPPACPEVFRYQAPTESSPAGKLDCVSCNPTGQRPTGLSGIPTGSHTSSQEWEGMYQSRALSADGARAFFDSYDALVPQDTNGKLDVYEWEEAGEGTCAESSSTFSQASGGCLSLISSGTGSESSAFMDASADGSDVFFITGSSLVKQDPGSVDLYDAREGGGLPEPAPPTASCQGDACQSPPTAPNDPTPASSTYNGPGNEHPAKPRCAKGKVRSRGKCVAKKHQKAKHKRGGRR